MPNSISAVALVVHDYDEAVHFFTHALRFTVVEDTPLPDGKRWVTVRPSGGGAALLLAKAAEKYAVTVLPDCCTTVSEILHLVALHAVSTRLKLVPSGEAL